ncbi:zinc-binding dehydrogenase [Streptomyces sp. ASQP_92]|uniref:zinc-binding dehydrogenase n=1 Tax=Streptomyces sp. ASQP_92 TaxID=2979116 RepID=UPI0021C057DC|nr:zinc-binding dehydrogenase [Streptomyces sp. ASQP_92]MCT9091174.1 zinc-binding dehydrogenase [Streptomyces sp. ASQP_92]
MRVAQVREFGGPEVLVPVEVVDPVAGAGEVVVAVDHIDTLFVQTQIRAGGFREFFGIEPPYVPGGGVSGTVAAAGPGVDAAWVGRRVAVSGIDDTYAELVTAPAARLSPVPDGVGPREAASLVHDAVTALALLENTALKPGETVLITGASGGMGTLLVQLAHGLGARVAGVARGPEKTALVRKLGADLVIDAGEQEWGRRARAALGEGGADLVLDGVGGQLGRDAFALTADGGRFSAHGAPSGTGFAAVDPDEARRRDIALLGIGDIQVTAERRTALLDRALREAAAGRLRPVIGGVFPLARAADAHRAIEGRGLVGKVLLTP